MNLGELDVHSEHHNLSQLERKLTPELPVAPVHLRLDEVRSPSINSTVSDPATVIPWETPPPRSQAPQNDLAFPTSAVIHQSIGANAAAHASNIPLVVRLDEEQVRGTEAVALDEWRMEDNDLDSYPPTPNIDDTPYIRFALDALTRDRGVRAPYRPSTAASSDSYPVDRIVPDHGLGYINSTREGLALARKHRSSPEDGPLFNYNATRPLSDHSDASAFNMPVKDGPSHSEIFIPVKPPVNSPRHSDLTFVPMMLRPMSMITLSMLCLLMTVALIYCAIYSTNHHGLMEWHGGIYGGRFFIFRFLPQMLAAFIFLYVQGVMSAMTRIMPCVLMAMDAPENRGNALFIGIFSGSLPRPRLNGPIAIDIATSFFCLTTFTIPLQSCLFSVILVEGEWRWAAVRGVAWTLVAIYILALTATIITGLFFFRRTTGLMWDPRSLADLILFLPRSNSLRKYAGTDVMRDKEEIRTQLDLRSDRLGYWRTRNRHQGIFYCVGEEGEPTPQYTLEAGKIHEKPSKLDVYESPNDEEMADLYVTNTRFRHIPWYLRDTFVIFWSVSAFVFVLAIIIVSFMPSTAIRHGFRPMISALPNSDGFSPANFLYSFVPSLIGLFLYLIFQPLDMAVRKLQPWVELGKIEGATAEHSLLLEYTAALPIECTLSALSRGHYRVAALSMLSFIFVLLPVLGGGLFFALTTISGDVRMIPNLTSFYIIVALLCLYLLGLLLLLPNRRQMFLPHDVDCLSEIFSFVYDTKILDDAAFRAPRTKPDLVTRLVAIHAGGQPARYAFGIYRGRHGIECLGIERLGRKGAQDVIVLSRS